MEERNTKIIDRRLLYGFLVLELLVLITLKLVQTVYPSSIADTFLMFGAIMINVIFMLLLVLRVKGAGNGDLR